VPDTMHNPGLPPSEIIARIEKALAIDGTHTWEDLRALLGEGKCQIFWNEHGAWITEIMVSPQKRMLNVWIVAGELPEVMDLQEKVEDHARISKCGEMIVRGARLGWKNVAKEYGWEETAVVLRHPVTGV
jgi:hypothetical protein